MTLNDTIALLQQRQIELWVDSGQLRYRAPEEAIDDEVLGLLRQHKPALLRHLANASQPRPTLVPVERDPLGMPLSFGQERFWLLEQIFPGRPQHNISATSKLVGPLRIETLEQALSMVVERHESLRTVYVSANGQVAQRVVEAEPFRVVVDDLRTVRECDRQAELKRRAHAERATPFDLTCSPLLRVRLYRLSPEEHVTQLTVHHIAADGWSMELLSGEVGAAYEAICSGREPSLPELPVQYVDYALWQRKSLRGDALDRQLAHWKKSLLPEAAELGLPLDYPRPPTSSNSSAGCWGQLSTELSDAVRQFSRRESVSMFTVLLTAYKVMLARLSGQHDICVGTPVANRDHVDVQKVIGLFLNTVVLRSDVRASLTFRELLTQVKEVAQGAFTHQDVPIEKLLEELQPKRDLSRQPLFQAFFNMMVMDVVAESEMSVEGLTQVPFDLLGRSAQFDISLYAADHPDCIRTGIVYDPELFADDRMQDYLLQYEQLLAQIVDNPDRPLGDYSLVTTASSAQLPDPSAPAEAPQSESIVERFCRRVIESPEKSAIVDSQGEMSYATLDALSNRVAHGVSAQGCGTGDVVAVYTDRRLELPCALLGILKAGAAFTILDSAYPSERLLQQIEIAQPKAMICIGEVPDTIHSAASDLPGGFIEFARSSGEALEHSSDELSAVSHAAGNLAYVAFTSGTTGRPKAVEGTLAPLDHFVSWYTDTFDLTSDDRFSMLSGLGHDPLLRDVFVPLCLGATIHVPSADHLSPGELTYWLEESGVTVMHLTPALEHVITTAIDSVGGETAGGRLHSLRYAVFGGDELRCSHTERLTQIAPHVTCVNVYGATETPQVAGYHVVDLSEQKRGARQRVPIGRGIADTQLLVLGSEDRLCGVGELGEVCVRTRFLSRGFVDDRLLTEERFVTNPYGSDKTDRIYRTGDLGRYLTDGRVVLAGRNDRQIKLRGFRLELGEVEGTLASHPDVHETVVVVKGESMTEKRIIAYVLGEESLVVAKLQQWLRDRLPNYALPAQICKCEQFPRTANGKIDFANLPEPASQQDSPSPVPPAPLDELEAQLTKIFQQVLKVRSIGPDDSFFDLGGHSLKAVSLFARIEDLTGKKLPLSILFRSPSVRELATALRASGDPIWTSLVAIRADGSKPPLFCIHPLGGYGLYYRDLAKYLDVERPLYALQSQGLDGKGQAYDTVEAMSAHYIKEVRVAQPEGPYYLCGQCLGGVAAFEMARQLEAMGETVAFVGLIDTYTPQYVQSLRQHRTLEAFWDTVRLRWDLELSTIGLLPWRQRPGYLWGKVVTVTRRLRQKLRNMFRRRRHDQQGQLESVQQVNARAFHRFVPQPYSGHVDLFRASKQPGGRFYDPLLGWKGLVEGNLEIHETSGHHATIAQEPRVRLLASLLQNCLDRTELQGSVDCLGRVSVGSNDSTAIVGLDRGLSEDHASSIGSE